MSGGGKGGSSTTSVEIPQYIEDASRRNLARADEIAKLGYVPYYGPDVAAFTPMQNAAFANTAGAANAFGMEAPTGRAATGMPKPKTFAGGVQGYSSGSLYDQALAELKARRPGQFKAINDMFINPKTGKQPKNKAFSQSITAPTAERLAADSLLAQMLASEGSGGGDASSPVVGGSRSFTSSDLRAALPGGVNDPFLTSGFSQAVARTFDRPQSPPTSDDRPVQRPTSATSSRSSSSSNTSSSRAPTSSPRPNARPSSAPSRSSSYSGPRFGGGR